MNRSLLLIAFVVFLLSTQFSFSEDPPTMTEKTKLVAGLNYTYIKFNLEEDFDFLSGIYELMIDVPINNKSSLTFLLPYSTYSLNGQNMSGIGNLTVGIKHISESPNPLHVKAAVSLPTISDRNLVVSYLSIADFWNFNYHLWGGMTLDIDLEKRYNTGNGMFYGFGIGNFIAIPKESEGETEDFVKFVIKGGYEKNNSIGFDVAFRGIFMLTQNNEFVNMLNLGISYKTDLINPRLFVVLPVGDNYSELIKNLLGFSIKFNLK